MIIMGTVENNKIQNLLELKPFDTNQNKKTNIFLDAIKESIIHHTKNSLEFQKICKKNPLH